MGAATDFGASDGWLMEAPEIPGVLTYSATANAAMAKAETPALRALAERIESCWRKFFVTAT